MTAQSVPTEDFTREVAEEVERRLRALGDDKVQSLAQHWTAVQVADAMIRPLPVASVRSPVNGVIGPFHTTNSLIALRKVTREAIRQAAVKGDILRLWTRDGKPVYPAFQFGPQGEYLPGLRAVSEELAKGHDDPWLWAQWLNGRAATATNAPALTNAALLWAGHLSEVLDRARRTAGAWAA